MPELPVPIRSRGVLVRSASVSLETPPQAKPLPAYLDTGASDTMLDFDVLRQLDLQPERRASLNVLGRENVSYHPICQVEIAVVHPHEPARWLPLAVLGGSVYPTGAVAALGRDFLRHFVLTYDGPLKQACLRW